MDIGQRDRLVEVLREDFTLFELVVLEGYRVVIKVDVEGSKYSKYYFGLKREGEE